MNLDWHMIGGYARVIYAKAAQLVVFMIVCFYLLCCLVAGKPVGLKAYVNFTYHCFQWHPDSLPVIRTIIR